MLVLDFSALLHDSRYLYTTGYFLKRRVILKQQFTIEKGYYSCMNHFTIHHILSLSGREYILSRYALRLLKIIEPYLVEQERMANAQLLSYGSKQTDQNSSN
jgi:hypothetical protein